MKDYLRFALLNFRARKVRTALTILGIIIGISAVVSLISLGQGLQSTINEQFKALGGDKLIIAPRGNLFGTGAPQSSAILDEHDLDVIRSVRGVESAGGMIAKFGLVSFSDEKKTTTVIGIPQDETTDIFLQIHNVKIIAGRQLRLNDRHAAIIGNLLYTDDFFKKKVALHDTLTIEGVDYHVVGVLDKIGNPSDDSQVMIPLDSARETFNEPTRFSFIMGKTASGYNTSEVAELAKRTLRRDRSEKEDEETFEVQTFDQILSTFQDIFLVVQAILIGIAAISLLVGGVGIMNTMYTSVLQRTSEIGVMKAIGARNADILLIFLIESGFLGVAGGSIGIGLGVGFGLLVKSGAAQAGIIFSPAFTPALLGGSLIFSFFIGSIAGIAPAYRASKLKPIEALRYE